MPETIAIDLTTLAKTRGFPRAAFEFIDRGLAFTVDRIHGSTPDDDFDHDGEIDEQDEAFDDRHVTGVDLCFGLRDYAIEQYGAMAPTVLKHWGVTCTEHFGQMVFAMVEAGRMHKTDDDTLADFRDIFDFRHAFQQEELLLENV